MAKSKATDRTGIYSLLPAKNYKDMWQTAWVHGGVKNWNYEDIQIASDWVTIRTKALHSQLISTFVFINSFCLSFRSCSFKLMKGLLNSERKWRQAVRKGDRSDGGSGSGNGQEDQQWHLISIPLCGTHSPVHPVGWSQRNCWSDPSPSSHT